MVHLAGEASKLVVIADSEIRAVPLHHCDSPAANSCVACVSLQDPHCAWDDTTDLCVAVPTKLHANDASKTLFQDIINGKHKGCGYEEGKKIILGIQDPSLFLSISFFLYLYSYKNRQHPNTIRITHSCLYKLLLTNYFLLLCFSILFLLFI